jgi:preprotein translocase subunit SecG
MMIAVTIVHVITCFILVVIVLLQTGKGADMGAVFGGGSSSTIFGSSGAGNLLTKITTGAAIVFMATSLTLAYSAGHRRPATIFDRTAAPEAPAPTAEVAGKDAAQEGVEEEAQEEAVAAGAQDTAVPAAKAADPAPAAAAAAPTDAAAGKAAPEAAPPPPAAAPAPADAAPRP